MTQKANPTLIGAFLLGALSFIFIAIFIFGSVDLFTKHETFVMYFEDSVNGLEVGAPVKFKGVPVGIVQKIMLHWNQGQGPRIPVLVEIDTSKMNDFFKGRYPYAKGDLFEIEISEGLRAKLNYESILTGILFIELDYFNKSIPPIFVQSKYVYKEIPTVSDGIFQIFQDATSLITRINSIDFENIGQKINHILKNVDDGVQAIQFQKINDSFITAGESISQFFNSPKFDNFLTSSTLAMQDFQKMSQKIEQVVQPSAEEFQKATIEAQQTFQTARNTFSSIDSFFDPNSEFNYELMQTLREFRQASQSVKALADTLDRNPNSILSGNSIQFDELN